MTAKLINLSDHSTPSKPMPPDPKLTDHQLRALRILAEAGGLPLVSPVNGYSVVLDTSVPELLTWVELLSLGCIYGGSGRIYPTDLGRSVIGRRT